MFACRILDTSGNLSKKWVRNIRDDESQSSTMTGSELAREAVGYEIEIIDGFTDPLEGFRGHNVGSV